MPWKHRTRGRWYVITMMTVKKRRRMVGVKRIKVKMWSIQKMEEKERG